MDVLTSTKPYMIRGIHEWCIDNGLTPHLLVQVNSQTLVPRAYVKDSEIVLNLNYKATKDLLLDNEAISFSARFGGVSQNIYVPISRVKGIFARENGQGLFFEIDSLPVAAENPKNTKKIDEIDEIDSPKKINIKKPTLTIVK